jgi:single-stranded DNA-binding protein
MLKVLCVGTVVRDPMAKPATSDKKAFTSLTVVSNRYAGTNQDGTAKYEGQFLNCVAFDKTAELMSKLAKGDKVFVQGEIMIDSYEKDGETQTNLKCIVREWEKVSAAGSGAPKAEAAKETVDADDDEGDEVVDPFN